MALLPDHQPFVPRSPFKKAFQISHAYKLSGVSWHQEVRHLQKRSEEVLAESDHPVAPASNPDKMSLENDDKGPLDYVKIDEDMACHHSANFVISCGTVTFDLEESKVLLIYHFKHGIWQLPKGRKDIGEGFPEAATRETREETGYKVRLLDLKVRTRATEPRTAPQCGSAGKSTGHNKPTRTPNTEPVAMTTYTDPQAEWDTPEEEDQQVSKMVFYYAAVPEHRGQPPDKGTQEDHENMKAEWHPIPEAIKLLRFKADKEVVRKAVADLKFSGLGIVDA